MKIAQVSPLFESVPPKLYGGTERVVSFLTDTLVDMGHDVTLFASGDSITKAKLQCVTPNALRLAGIRDPFSLHTLQLQQVIEMADEFDIIHFHTDYFHFPVSRLSTYNHVTTLHGRLDLPELAPLYAQFDDIPLVSISMAQRIPVSFANWVGNVYHGVPGALLKPGDGKGGYAVFIGRFSPEKGVDQAIEIAARAGLKIKIAAKVDPADHEYYEGNIKPLLNLPHVEYLGEVNEEQKQELLANALVFLLPIAWPEPFGMVMIESLACGTPVVAYGLGSVPEVLENGKTGFVVHDIERAVHAVARIDQISRDYCRQTFEERFEARRMAIEYVEIYEKIIREDKQIRLPAASNEKTVFNEYKNILSA
ncbi:MAG TPA: glycosyltransferase family 4 protein [Ohtaekwangia sp.]|nr:glycosyltransferase family 4 protein [Ohtaekwangia sp.]